MTSGCAREETAAHELRGVVVAHALAFRRPPCVFSFIFFRETPRRDERDDVDERRDRSLRSRHPPRDIAEKKKNQPSWTHTSDRSTTNIGTPSPFGVSDAYAPLVDASTHRAWVMGIVHRGHEHDVRVFVEQVLRAVAARAHRAGGVVHQHGDAASARHQESGEFQPRRRFFHRRDLKKNSKTESSCQLRRGILCV